MSPPPTSCFGSRGDVDSLCLVRAPTFGSKSLLHTEIGRVEIPMEMASFCLGMPIGFNRYENSKYGQEVSASMVEDARQIGHSKRRITQKMHALIMFVLPRIDYRVMCADLIRSHLDRWDAQIRGMVEEGFGIHRTLVELFQMSWMNGRFSLPSLRDRQNALVIRTILSMLTYSDDFARKLMKQFEIEQGRNCDIECKDRERGRTTGFLNWNPTFDQTEVNPDAHTQSIFPRALKVHQEDQISFWVHNGAQFLIRAIAEPFNE